MALSIAEYLGVNTRTGNPQPNQNGQCPFTALPCTKLTRGEKPTCSAWTEQDRLWVICQDRLLSASKQNPVTHPYIAERLHEIAHVLWPENPADPAHLAVARQFKILGSSCDYVFGINPGWSVTTLPVRYVMEVQAGGVTGNTQYITQAVQNWEQGNAALTVQTAASPDPYSVWKRLLVQLFTKGIAAVNARQGVGCVVGEELSYWLESRLHWSALTMPADGYVDFVVIPYRTADANHSPILMVPDAERVIRSTFKSFLELLQQSEEAAAFTGAYTDLNGGLVVVP